MSLVAPLTPRQWDGLARIAQLPRGMTTADRIQALEDRVEWLERALGLDFAEAPRWGMTRFQMQVIGVLLKVKVASYDRLMTALYSDRLEEPNEGTIKAHVCHIRKKWAPFGLFIDNVYGIGYALTDETRAALTKE